MFLTPVIALLLIIYGVFPFVFAGLFTFVVVYISSFIFWEWIVLLIYPTAAIYGFLLAFKIYKYFGILPPSRNGVGGGEGPVDSGF